MDYFYLIVGLKNNDASVLNLVEVDITLYDVNNKVIETSMTYTNPRIIQPFGTAAY